MASKTAENLAEVILGTTKGSHWSIVGTTKGYDWLILARYAVFLHHRRLRDEQKPRFQGRFSRIFPRNKCLQVFIGIEVLHRVKTL